MGVRIIVDSCADLRAEVKEKVSVVPLVVRFGDNELLDGVTIDKSTFYEMLVESDTLPTTSQATPDMFARAFAEAVDAGDSVVAITISSKLSGTYQSACIAAADYDCVHVVDSLNAAVGEGVLTEYALSCAEAGMGAADLANILEGKKKDVRVVALLDTLEYLKRGGRISRAAAFAGGLLNLKPVIAIEDGALVPMGKARGSKQGNNLLCEKIRQSGGVDFSMPLLLGYTGIEDSLLQKYIADSRPLWDGHTQTLHCVQVGSVVGTHAGPGAIVCAYFAAGN